MDHVKLARVELGDGSGRLLLEGVFEGRADPAEALIVSPIDAREPSLIVGAVLSESGEAVGGAEIELLSECDGCHYRVTSIADADGSFSLPTTGCGIELLSARSRDRKLFGSVLVPKDKSELAALPEGRVILRLVRGASLNVGVVARDSRPMPGAMVGLFRKAAGVGRDSVRDSTLLSVGATDEHGTVSLGPVGTGMYDIVIVPTGAPSGAYRNIDMELRSRPIGASCVIAADQFDSIVLRVESE